MRIRSPPGDDEPPWVCDHRVRAAYGRGKLGDPSAADEPGVTGGQQFHIASRRDSTPKVRETVPDDRPRRTHALSGLNCPQ